MAFAPILDPTAYTSDTEPKRRLQLAAASLLQRLAAHDDLLRSAIERLPAIDAGAEARAAARAAIAALLGAPPPPEPVHLQLVEQLLEVKAFCELDNGSVADNIGPAGRLIRSGRVELFAGR